jgi:hypothetical protein
MFKPLLDEDLPVASALLIEGFPERGVAFWNDGLRRMWQHAGNAAVGVPLGLLMMDGTQAVGVALTPASRRFRADGSAYTLVNLSSWYVRPQFRWRAGLMLRSMLSDPSHAYVDLTPSEDVKRMLPLFGFKPVNQGTTIAVLPAYAAGSSQGARIRPLQPTDDLPPGAPPMEMLIGHRQLNCESLVLDHPEGRTLLVYRPRRLRRLPGARLKFIGDHAVLYRHLPVVARHLLSRGMVMLSWDTRPERCPGVPLFHLPGGIWYARGENFDHCSDFIGTELCILGV